MLEINEYYEKKLSHVRGMRVLERGKINIFRSVVKIDFKDQKP